MTLLELFALLKRHLLLVIIMPVAVAGIVGVVSLFLPAEYTATTTMYVLSKNGEEEAPAITQSDLSVGQMITNDVTTILKSDRVRQDVASELGLASLAGYKLSVTSTTTTRVITLSVTGTDAQKAADIANALVARTSQVATEVMQIEAINVIDAATPPDTPSGPRRVLYTAVGFMAGLFAAVAIIVIRDMADTRVRSGSDVEELIGVPVVGHFPAVDRS